MDAHDHAPKAACSPSCPGWAEGALSLFAFQRRHAEMLEACRAAAAIELVDVAPSTQGVVLPDYLKEEAVEGRRRGSTSRGTRSRPGARGR